MMQLKVCYLDDESDLLEIFKDIFESSEVKIDIFSDPNAFLLNVEAAKPDLIFLDYGLPGTNGDVIALQVPKEIPKVLVTGDLNHQYKCDYLSIIKKPINIDAVNEILMSFWQSKKSRETF